VSISTGPSSRDTRAEAVRDEACTIDLVDGEELAALLKQYELGVKTVIVERILVDRPAQNDPRGGGGQYGHGVQNRSQCSSLPLPISHRLMRKNDG
jgi:hypothetical protein